MFDIISAAFSATVESKGYDHFQRPAGSQVKGLDTSDGQAVVDWLKGLSWVEVTDTADKLGARFGACCYFRADIPAGYEGLEGIALGNELSDADLANVRVVRGHHGALELQLPGAAKRPVDVVHMIIGNGVDFPEGNPEDAPIVVTWYPGRLTGPSQLEDAVVKFVE
jgi:hypothetical protein